MNHDTLRILALYTVYFLLFLIPLLAFIFTDQFRRLPSPRQYAVLFATAAMIGILLFVPAISVVAGTALGALALAWTSARFATHGVTYTRTLSPPRLFPGDHARLQLELRNHKVLPLGWLSIHDPIEMGAVRSSIDLDDMLHISAGVSLQDNQQHALILRTGVAPYQQVTRTYDVTALQRGVYTFGPAHLATGDPFGIFTRTETVGERQEILVYPHVYRPEELGLPFREVMGTLVARRALIHDPTLLAGSRAYHPGDPLNRMHWKATARTGQLQVRLQDPSTAARVMIVLNLNTFVHPWQGIDVGRMEAVIDAAASIALWALDHDFAVGVRSNGAVRGVDTTGRIAPAGHPRQATVILEHLARLSFSGRFPAEQIVLDEADRLSPGITIMVVTSVMSAGLVQALTSARLTGRVAVTYCGRAAAPAIPNLPTYFVQPPRGGHGVAA